MQPVFLIILAFLLAGCGNSPGSAENVLNDTVAGGTVAADTVAAKSNELVRDTKPYAQTYIQRFGTTKNELEIANELLKLPFVLKSELYIDSLTNHVQGISFMLDSAASNEKEISIQAGYNGPERFETYYRFFVNPKTKEIKVYDPVLDKKLSVKQYLKTLK